MSFTREHTVKATRKAHRCDGCERQIDTGFPAVRWSGMTDGDFGTAIYHVECRAAEVALNHAIGWHPGDDWTRLAEIEREDRIWLEQEYQAVFARMFGGSHD